MLTVAAISTMIAAVISGRNRDLFEKEQLEALERTLGVDEGSDGEREPDGIPPARTHGRLSWDDLHDLPDKYEHLMDQSIEPAESDLGEFEDYYPQTASGGICDDPSLYHERSVAWAGIEGKMMRVHWSEASSIWGNIFDPDKLGAVAHAVQHYPEKLCFTAAYGDPNIIGLTDIVESLQDDEEGTKLSTGDEDLDEFLTDPEWWLSSKDMLGDINLVPGFPFALSEEQFDLFNEIEDEIEELMDAGEPLDSRQRRYLDDKVEFVRHGAGGIVIDRQLGLPLTVPEGVDAVSEMRELLDEAKSDRSGDFGKLRFQFRDGNHRVFGSFLGGEDYVWVIVMDNKLQNIRSAQARRARGEQLSTHETELVMMGDLLQ
jgi:hypothetical protein